MLHQEIRKRKWKLKFSVSLWYASEWIKLSFMSSNSQWSFRFSSSSNFIAYLYFLEYSKKIRKINKEKTFDFASTSSFFCQHISLHRRHITNKRELGWGRENNLCQTFQVYSQIVFFLHCDIGFQFVSLQFQDSIRGNCLYFLTEF